LIGPNGAGKTTLFNVITRLYRPDAGELDFDDRSLLRTPPHRIVRRGIARTFQNVELFRTMTVLDNVLVGAHTRFASSLWSVLLGTARASEAERRKRAEEMVQFVGLGELREADVTTLSFGQGRLLEIARALAGEPRLILFDEPAAGLTPAECARLAEIIRGIAARGIAVLLIEHDMHFLLPLAQRVVVLNFGAKIADGLPEEIRANPAVMDAYLGSHAAHQ